MDEHVLQHYLEKVPVEIREAVMELNTPQKWAVYISLTVDGDKYFNELKKQFNANPKTMNDVLKSLVASGLIAKKVKVPGDIGSANKSYYTTTRLGEKLLINLYEVILPPFSNRELSPGTLMITKQDGKGIGAVNIPKQTIEYHLNETQKFVKFEMVGVQV